MKKITYYLLFTLLFFSCKQDEFEAITSEELRPFIDDFVVEGEKRGVTLSADRLEAFLLTALSEERADNVCGLGWSNFNNQQTQRIEILNNELCWDSRSEIERENLIFHELGHALLGRDHLNSTFPNGISNSIMCSGSEGFCSNFGVYYDNEILKDYYLDELFDETTSLPPFTQKTNVGRTVFEDQFEDGLADWEEFILGDSSFFEVTIDTTGNQVTTAPNALKIEVKPNTPEDESVIMVRRFELANFNECSNLIFKSDIRTEGEFDGSIVVALSLRERLADGSLNRFYLNRIAIEDIKNPTDFFEDYALEMYCVSRRTNVVSVSFALQSKLPVKVYIENVRVELVE